MPPAFQVPVAFSVPSAVTSLTVKPVAVAVPEKSAAVPPSPTAVPRMILPPMTALNDPRSSVGGSSVKSSPENVPQKAAAGEPSV